MRRAHDGRVRLAVGGDVVGEAARADDEARILLPLHRRPDHRRAPAAARRIVPSVLHRPPVDDNRPAAFTSFAVGGGTMPRRQECRIAARGSRRVQWVRWEPPRRLSVYNARS
jgi:hypothetical protein